MSEVLIALRNVTFGYDAAQPVLRDVVLEIQKGDRIALTGRNGSGKTTLLHLLVGLLRPQAGHVEEGGKTCRREEDFVGVRRRVALLFQDSEDQLFCPTVIEDVAFGPLNLGHSPPAAKAVALDALSRVGMSAYEDRIVHHLSVGEKKLIAFAGILAMRPRVMLLDEPTAGLDEQAVDRVVTPLNALDSAMIVASQDHAFLDRVTQRRMTLSDGRLASMG